jgi:two-component system response regulator DctR
MTAAEPHVYVVEDDPQLRDALVFLIGSRGLKAKGFASAEEFLPCWSPALSGCILTDVRMSGMSGLELFDRLKAQGCKLPCIVLTGHGDVPMAVEALKKGVHDFIEKPFDGNTLVDRLIAAMEADRARVAEAAEANALRGRLAALSSRERDVLPLMLAGKPNKVIADELGIAVRTVEVHRARVLEKMGVKSAVELATLLAGVGRD